MEAPSAAAGHFMYVSVNFQQRCCPAGSVPTPPWSPSPSQQLLKGTSSFYLQPSSCKLQLLFEVLLLPTHLASRHYGLLNRITVEVSVLTRCLRTSTVSALSYGSSSVITVTPGDSGAGGCTYCPINTSSL